MGGNHKIVILGAGESGLGAAVLAVKKGFEVFLSDKGKIKDKYKEMLSKYKIHWEEGSHTEEKIWDANEVIKSPGIPDNAELLVRLKGNGVPVISEIEFAARYTTAKKICITGSNGKTTTTMLTYHILKKAGYNVGLAGNVGKSFALQVAENMHDYYVLELSSFQLDGMVDFKADIAVLLNITPDHLDRYNYEFQQYVDSKFRVIQNQSNADAFVYCQDDKVITKEIEKRKPKAFLYPFSIAEKLDEGAYLEGTQLTININHKPFFMQIQDLALQGRHNIYNSMAAAIVSRIVDIKKDIIRESLADFQNIEHRMEFVTRVHGIEFVNDSKGTNVNSTWYALESMTNPVIWILGGVDKGNDYSCLKALAKEKVKGIICLGVDNKKIIKEFADIIPNIVEASSAEDAVKKAYHMGKKGDTVLLSPACASFDLFDNFEDRGNKFKQAVRSL